MSINPYQNFWNHIPYVVARTNNYFQNSSTFYRQMCPEVPIRVKLDSHTQREETEQVKIVYLNATFICKSVRRVGTHCLSNNFNRLMFQVVLSNEVFASKNSATTAVWSGATRNIVIHQNLHKTNFKTTWNILYDRHFDPDHKKIKRLSTIPACTVFLGQRSNCIFAWASSQ